LKERRTGTVIVKNEPELKKDSKSKKTMAEKEER